MKYGEVCGILYKKGGIAVSELLNEFVNVEVNEITYGELWNFVSSNSICRGTFECTTHVVMKISSTQFVIYKICVGAENTKCQEAVLVAKNYLLKKINSRAYQLHLPDIQNIFD